MCSWIAHGNWCCVEVVPWGASTPPFISKGAMLQEREPGWLQHDPNQDSISTCPFYIYFYRYNFLCLEEHVMVFWMVGRVIMDPSLGLLSPCEVVPRVLILVSSPRVVGK
jgi:hypothetical protein